MASKNSVLLVIKQRPGIKYNDLLAKIVSEYSNINSARAALSRLVKDLEAPGLVRRKHNNLYLTDKGVLKVQTEMKNKLLLKLNELVSEPDPQKPGPLVQQLSVLVERSKKDPDLLSVAKSSISFPVSRLDKINDDIARQSKHLAYLSRIISKHAKAMRAMDFRDSVELKLNERKKGKLISGVSRALEGDFIVKCSSEEKTEKLKEKFGGKIQGKDILFPAKKFEKLAFYLLGGKASDISIIAAGIRIDIDNEKTTLAGPAKRVLELKK